MENKSLLKNWEGNGLCNFLKNVLSLIYKYMDRIMKMSDIYVHWWINELKNLQQNRPKLLYVIIINVLVLMCTCFLMIKYMIKCKNNNCIDKNFGYNEKGRRITNKTSRKKGTHKRKDVQINQFVEKDEYKDEQNELEVKSDLVCYSNNEQDENYTTKKKTSRQKRGRKTKREVLKNSLSNNSDLYVDLPQAQLNIKEQEKEKAILDQTKRTRSRKGISKKQVTIIEETDESPNNR
ncbi:conserved Plasmodium protein, unknown function [Plasmodium ovale]|uniref:Uncharacterized protein n=2 Tax=Plasmodium ovale TaxID=36330 RepID=A0A1A8VZ11_PLAOA|nr:conserved Plasmodium protein, unknown function [Plasmodium ovale curtisi]SBS92204.1 conserved Plasmodium protein, unknown function [Plasmodium ovale curtisi]SCP04787.1 conserved Plasmodium protein, unknown function [Plasmodium ovale]